MPEAAGSLTWSLTKIAAEALRARTAAELIKVRILDKSSECMGIKMQQIDIPEIDKVITHAIGLRGGVTPQDDSPSSVSLVIDQPRESTRDFPLTDSVQSVVNKKKHFGFMAGKAHGQFVEDFILALETGNTGTQDVAGSLTDTILLTNWAALENADVPKENRHLYVSPGQAAALLDIDKFTDADFIGSVKNMPTKSGILTPIYGCEPISGTRVRNRTVGAPSVPRAINMMFQRECWAVGVQKNVSRRLLQVDLADRIILWMLFGATRTRDNHIRLMRTSNA